MRLIKTIVTLQKVLADYRRQGKTIGFVPTMGYLHEGHAQLLREARKTHDVVVLSIYVNPTQFGPKEDFNRYPRDLRRDSTLARKENVDIVFIPSHNEIYPEGYATYIDVTGLSEKLCGAYRPGHFRGVATVVAKLVQIVQPNEMYLGKKDAQQVVVIKRMLTDLNIPIKLTAVATVRESDGLALSSRNKYLNQEERCQAVVISTALFKAKAAIQSAEKRSARIKMLVEDQIKQSPLAKIQYIACVDAQTLEPIQVIKGHVLIAVAVFFGKVRLIDNIDLKVNEPRQIKS